jgi:hypothetical protein
LRARGATSLYLFGSTARNDAKAGSEKKIEGKATRVF